MTKQGTTPSKGKLAKSNNVRQPAELKGAKPSVKKPAEVKKNSPVKTKPQKEAPPSKKAIKGSLTSLNRESLNRIKIISVVLLLLCILAAGTIFALRNKIWKSSLSQADAGTGPTQSGTSNNINKNPQTSGTPNSNPAVENINVNVSIGSPLPADAKLKLQQADWSQILISQQPDLSYKPSTIYFANDLIKAVEQMVQYGVGSQKLWFGDGNSVYGLVSVAAFLAQSMKETIKYDACDENNWNMQNGYSAANACGQLGQAYDKYLCSGAEVGMECKIDPNKVVVAKTHAKWYGAPGPLFAAPKSIVPKAPKWNYGSPWCDPNQVRSLFTSDLDYVKAIAANDGSATCKMYQGQKAGGWELCGGQACPSDPAPSFNVPARTDVEGCYFWGRGVIQTTGVCNYGKLNYYAGKKAADSNRPSLFPEIDFCSSPEEICQNAKYPELKWFSGLFYWLNAVQDYDDGKYNYKNMLKQFVDGGFKNPGSDTGFIHGVSGIVNRGCADPPNCGTGPLDGGPERAQNFEKVLKAFKLV